VSDRDGDVECVTDSEFEWEPDRELDADSETLTEVVLDVERVMLVVATGDADSDFVGEASWVGVQDCVITTDIDFDGDCDFDKEVETLVDVVTSREVEGVGLTVFTSVKLGDSEILIVRLADP
jgi:hypothetical protein